VDHINAEGGTVTLDVPIAANGKIPAAVLRRLMELGKDIDQLTDGVRSF
jgi:alpha-L-fucosidase